MRKTFTPAMGMAIFTALVSLNFQQLCAQEQVYRYAKNTGKEGYSLMRQNEKGVGINFSITQFSTVENEINGKKAQNISLSGMFMPNEAGAPDLPGNQRYIAIPQGSKATLKVVSFNTEVIKNIDIAPAPVIPLDKYDSPLVYEKDNAIYSKDAFYPESPVILSAPSQIRGVDVVSLGVMPFQYNPVTKELVVYKDIQVEVNFEGGNGHFGDNAYRSRWWDPIMEDMILNYDQLPQIDYNEMVQKAVDSRATGCEYAIIIPNGPDFSKWADSVKKFRTEQGILTNIYKLSDIGSTTASGIQTWVKNAYSTWTIKPAAMLILADYGSDANSTVSANLYTHDDSSYPAFASDNYYADVSADNLPDVIFSRIVANNAAQLQVLCTKFLNYERNPPTDAPFYDKPITAAGWQDDRWFQLGAEIFGGYLTTLGKHPARVNALGSPASNSGNNTANSGTWSTASNTTTIVNFFGQNGLKYIPDKPGTLGGFSGGNATGINTAINNGAFMLLHRDHGYYGGWGEPSYSTSSINSLKNVNNKLPFIFSINCQTGAFHHSSEVVGEKFHRYTYSGQNSGALGVVGAAEVSYSFVNDAYIWGMFDNMWPSFMPANGTNPASRDMRPAFASAAGKYFLKQSSWTSSGTKLITYRLFHMFGDAFQWFYSEVPKNLTVVHNPTVPSTATTFAVTADAGSFIAITVAGPTGPVILGTATGTGSSVNITLAQAPTSNMLVTVTKQNYFRYGKIVTLGPTSVNDVLANELNLTCYPNPFSQSATLSYSLEKTENVTLTVYDMLGKEVTVILRDVTQSSGVHQVQFSSKDLLKGMYSCVLKTGSKVAVQNIVVE